ncbi:hypothetical protein J2S37_002281 [Corynebacterium felinum]|uniref:Uncharacterized protein n=1 Tax=Corynebacterium felinum TaxID=131318 RepID=A0ABU2BAV8_9CORY|nr:hypothetical protein [Corynebacterium felinum]
MPEGSCHKAIRIKTVDVVTPSNPRSSVLVAKTPNTSVRCDQSCLGSARETGIDSPQS